jgi:hypothetical protein
LVRELFAEAAKALLADDLGGTEVLELGGVGSGFSAKPDQHPGALKTAIVIGGNVRYEIGRVIVADDPLAESNGCHPCSPSKNLVSSPSPRRSALVQFLLQDALV